MKRDRLFQLAIMTLAHLCTAAICPTFGQSVCLPSPRLLTTMPMGIQAGSEAEVVLTGESLEGAEALIFSDSRITAMAKLDDQGLPIANTFIVSASQDCPSAIYDARVMARLGISSARAFSVSKLPEAKQTKPSTKIEDAFNLEINSICNATLVDRNVNHYRFEAKKDQKLFIDCAAKGIESRMNPVVIVADADGNDLLVERRGGALEFDVPVDGNYIVKVHDLTYNGGPHYFFRLAIQEYQDTAPQRQPSVSQVSSFSWPPAGIGPALAKEAEPNDPTQPQAITLPCDLSGQFYPAADVDSFEFSAKKGETWWVEVASERLGRPTDPVVVVQRVVEKDGEESLVDVVELSDIESPVKRSSNGYSYDGPPYNAGSSDVLGKLEIKEDGIYRLLVTDLFGGTRDDPKNVYRLVVRKAAPDFAIVGWALHMGLRNGDRNALSKPIALRGGATMPIEVIVIRRDGFEGEIELVMEDLPDGVTATGLNIGKNKSVGTMLVQANEGAPRGLSVTSLLGKATIEGKEVTRACRFASMKWPVVNARNDIPAPRLLATIPVSVGGAEQAAVSLTAASTATFEVAEKQTLTIPLVSKRRGEFSGKTMSLSTFGAGFERSTKLNYDLTKEQSEIKLDLAQLKIPPGDYMIAFYGGAVVKYNANPVAVADAEIAQELAKSKANRLAEQQKRLAADIESAEDDQKANLEKQLSDLAAEKKAADAATASAAKKMTAAVKASKPKDIVDIFVSDPINVRVLPAGEKTK